MRNDVVTIDKYSLPKPSQYFDREFIASAPLDEGEEALVKWLDVHLGEAVTQFDKAVDRPKEESRRTVRVIWRYVNAKHMDYSARTNTSDEPPAGLSPEMEQAAREMNRETRLAFNASYRAGMLDAYKDMLEVLGLEREARVIDKLFERAESASGVVVVPPAGRLTSGKR